MTRRARLTGLAALAAIATILIGIPTALIALGANPLPASLPAPGQVWDALTAPDDGTLAITAITVIAWLAWATFALSLLLEAAARARGATTPHLPGLALPQGAARALIGAAAALFLTLPTAPTALAAPATTSPAATATAPTTYLHTDTAPTAPDPQERTYTVQAGDTLTAIAHRMLGDGDRWLDLAALNPDVATHPDLIHPGTTLTLPAHPAPGTARSYTVRPGDTLSGIAATELGDGDRWPEIFRASRDTRQPDGRHITDPDQIDPGQILTIPTPGPPPTPAPPNPSPTRQQQPPPSPAPPNVPHTAPAPTIPPALTAHTPPTQDHQDTPDHRPVPTTPQQQTPTGAPAWMLTGLTGAGALLAGSLLVLLRHRRRAQFRHRRPGHTLASPAPALGPVEKTITTIGTLTAPTIEYLDEALRRLAAHAATQNIPMPVLAAAELTTTHLVLHLSEPADLPQPWEGTTDQKHWQIDAHTPLEQLGPHVIDQPAPYPLLVTIGLGENDAVWLLNIEDLDIAITGDATYGQDFARYLAAEVGCNPWSAGVALTCLGVATELGQLNPDRIHTQATATPAPIEQILADTLATIDAASDADTDVTTCRAHQTGADPWHPRMLLIDATTHTPALEQLLNLLHTHPGRTATSIVLTGSPTGAPAMTLHVSADGRLTLTDAGLDLIAVGLTPDEAAGCAALLAHSETLTDTPIPADQDATTGWRSFCDQAGVLRPEHTLPRHSDTPHTSDDTGEGTPEETTTLLDGDDATYLEAAATTTQDLHTLAPRVSQDVRHDLHDADPTLDDDLAMWLREDCPLPKLHLLGPVRATTRGKPLTKRKPYMTELLAFIALRRLGATPDEVADTFNITTAKARDYVLTVRQWLGTNPRTNDYHLPDARHTPAAATRAVPTYQVIDLLTDADLFRRLRARGQARGGPEGITDLTAALRLVHGRPFDYPAEREHGGGWAWLLDGDRLDEHLTIAIVDVAHLVATHALATHDLPTARLAAETAAMAAPYEEIPRLDLAAIAAAEGHHDQAARIIRDDICNRTDDDGPPPQLPARTEQILTTHKDWATTKAS